MLKKLVLQWSLKKSEGEILRFINTFSSVSTKENGNVMGMAALIHQQFIEKDPDFHATLINKNDSACGPASIYVIELNKLVSDLHAMGKYHEAAAMKLWNITFRCLSHQSLNKHGVSLWNIARASFPYAKQWLEAKLTNEHQSTNSKNLAQLQKAQKLFNFIPHRFI